MADPSTTRPNAPGSAMPSPARGPDGPSGSKLGSTVSMTPTNDDVDALGATVSGDFVAPAALRVESAPVASKPAATEASVITRVIPVGTPARSEEFLNVGPATDLASDSDGTSSVNSPSKKMHAQTLAGLAPPPELIAAAAESRRSAPIIPAAGSKAAPSASPAKLPLPPPRPGVVPAKPGSTPPAAPSGASRPPGSAPGFAPPPRPGASQPPRMAMQPPPLPPAVSVPLRPGVTPSPAAGFGQPNNVKRPSGPMAIITPSPPAVDPRRTNQAMPAIAAPPMPGDPRRTNQAMPAIAPPPMPSDLRRSSQAMPAVQAPLPPSDPRRSSQAMPAVSMPQGPADPRASAQGMPAVVPPGGAPPDPRRSSTGMPAVNPEEAESDVLPEAYHAISVKSGGTLPMINSGQGSSPNPPANQSRVELAFGEAAPPRMIYAPGTVIAGKYRLERILGQGGMGAVWVVRNINLDADFALKLIRRDRATEEAAARLLTEARAAAKLGHPGIVRVFDFGQTEVGDPYLVMELLSGDSFGALIARKKRLEPGVAVQMLLPVAAALAAAHGKGIVHRDLKPDNIMLATQDASRKLVPKVLDFGIARVLRDDIERHQTMAGEVLGSPDYMSPEQARGQLDIDHRTDIWTFAVLLYESITGKRPFEGHNYNALISSIVSNPPMPIHAYGVADTELSGIIDRGLSKSPTARWQTMRDMGIALATWAVEHQIDQDISGVSIQSEWLASQKPNLRTLQPAQLVRVAVPGAEPQGAHSTAPVVARDGAEWPGLRSDGRRKWIIGTVVLASFAVAFILASKANVFSWDSANSGADADAGPTSPTASASTRRVEPTTAATPAPTASEAAPQPSAKTSATSKTPATPSTSGTAPGPTTKRKAPPVPTNIKF